MDKGKMATAAKAIADLLSQARDNAGFGTILVHTPDVEGGPEGVIAGNEKLIAIVEAALEENSVKYNIPVDAVGVAKDG